MLRAAARQRLPSDEAVRLLRTGGSAMLTVLLVIEWVGLGLVLPGLALWLLATLLAEARYNRRVQAAAEAIHNRRRWRRILRETRGRRL